LCGSMPRERAGPVPNGIAPSAVSALQGLQWIGSGLLPGRRHDSRMAFVDGPHDVKGVERSTDRAVREHGSGSGARDDAGNRRTGTTQPGCVMMLW